MYSVETFDLTKKFKDVTAVNKINIKIKQGEVFGLLGPNGAGKTTLISMLCTLLQPTEGTATVNGFDIIKERDKVRKSIGVVFQDPSLDNRLTALENLYLHAGLYDVPKNERKKRINEVLELVSLKDKANILIKNYSGGMKRRLEIARGLIHYPKILFLDEPTLGLDPQTREHIWDYIKNLADRENITVIITTHYMEEADELCDRVAIIDNGEIKVLDKPSKLKDKLKGDTIIIETNASHDILSKIKSIQNVKSVQLIDGKTYISVENAEKNVVKILQTVKNVKSLSIRKPTLGDVFIHYTGKEFRDETSNGNINKRFLAKRL
ncbi:MAG: ATP-binding cassette domain-containing protein [Candidatus Aenigmatarchaeota archaeon]|nr:ATP-binding cassette domain-containing protein [Candidatus Aenigmarchaeota archaeon]